MDSIKETQLRYLEYTHRESAKRHHRYDEELFQYKLIKAGNMQSMEERKRMWCSEMTGRVNDDEIKNWKYIFVASIALACRAAIEGGMEEERSYDASDLYIQKLDRCKSLEEINKLHEDMFAFYTKSVMNAKKNSIFSKPVFEAMEYIHFHLHEKLTVSLVAEQVGLSPNYLSELFKRESGLSVNGYILEKRIEAAKNMLRYSSFSYDEISSTLAFSSQSHFIHVFKKAVQCTPREYRNRAYKEEQLNK